MKIKLTKEEIAVLQGILDKANKKEPVYDKSYDETHCPACGKRMDNMWACEKCFALANDNEDKVAVKAVMDRVRRLGIKKPGGDWWK